MPTHVFTLSPPVGLLTAGERSIVAVVDVSGSMAASADPPNAGEASGLSVLDVVKHALRTAVAMLGPLQTFALVKFSSTAEMVLPPLMMDADGHTAALACIERLETEGSTALWDGLVKGLEAARKSPYVSPAIFVLTDGQPDSTPPRGFAAALRTLYESTGVRASYHAFCFGTNVEKAVMLDIAEAGLGRFAYIPDASFVGTIFINAVARTLTESAFDVVATLAGVMPDEVKVLGGLAHRAVAWGVEIRLGALPGDAARHVVVETTGPAGAASGGPLSLTVTWTRRTGVPRGESTVAEETDALVIAEQTARCLFIDALLVGTLPALAQAARTLEAERGRSAVLAALHTDAAGEATLAFSHLHGWGKLYLPSLAGAHRNEYCLNFKDASLQHYGGNVFRALQDKGDEAFLKLPPPTRSIAANYGRGGRSYGGGIQAPVTMAAFHDRSGG